MARQHFLIKYFGFWTKNMESKKGTLVASDSPLGKSLLGAPIAGIEHFGWKLSKEERAYLGKFGVWMDALAKGKLLPTTSAQRNFVAVARGAKLPDSYAELLWKKWTALIAADHETVNADPFERARLRHSIAAHHEEYVKDHYDRLDAQGVPWRIGFEDPYK